MVLLHEECARILNCKNNFSKLTFLLKTNRACRAKVINALVGRRVRTIYQNCRNNEYHEDRNGEYQTFEIENISREGSAKLKALGRIFPHFNVTVCAYFYIWHKIRLRYPYLQCAVQYIGPRHFPRYYPMELLELVEDENIHSTPLLSVKFYRENDRDEDCQMDLGNDDDLLADGMRAMELESNDLSSLE